MNTTTAVHEHKTGMLDGVAAAAKEPLVWLAGFAPVWSGWLSNVSDLAGKLAPIAAVVLALARIWVVLRDRNAEAKPGDKLEKSTSLAWGAAGIAAKAGKFLPFLAAGLGAVALVAWLTSAKASAAPVVPAKASTSARKRSGKDNDDGGNDGDAPDNAPPTDAPPWFKSLHNDIGTKEIAGKRHNPKVVAYFRDAGFPATRDDETAWCAAAVNAHLERSGIPGSKSLAARSFLTWGRECEPRTGAVVVLHRGDPNGWQGHVGLLAGETATHVLLLGGNQGDMVKVARFPKSRVLAYRWPRQASELRTNRAAFLSASSSTGAGLSEAGAMAAEVPADDVPGILSQVQQSLEPIAPMLRGVAIVCALIGVASAVYVMWRRTRDLHERGV